MFQNHGNGLPEFAARFQTACRRGCNLLLTAFPLTVLLATGCTHDPRISLTRFVAMVEAEDAITSPTASRPALPPPKPRFVPYRIGSGDVLQITLVGLNAATDATGMQARVDRQGEIRLPLLTEPVKVGNLEKEDVERAITEKYVPAIVRALTVHVEVQTYDTTDLLVLGEVTTPGLVQMRRTERDLIHAVAAAGGFSLNASGVVTLQRGSAGGATISFDLHDPYDMARSVIVEPLQPGDVLLVETGDPFTIFVGGLVTAPGPKSFPPGTEINLLQVLATSGGIQEDLFPQEATLVRRMSDGSDVQVKLDIQRLRDGRDPNIQLAAGDILWVPETFGTRAVRFCNQNFFFRAGISTAYDPVQFERYRQTRNDARLSRKVQKRSNILRPFGGGGGSGAVNPLSIGDPLGFLQTNAPAAATATP